MGSVRFGGDPESYMDPPQMTQTDKPGGVSPIAAFLDLIGIGKRVEKAPAETPDAPATTQEVPTPPSQMPILNEAESAFKPIQPMPSDWGKRYLDSLKPIKTIDPNDAFGGGM